MTPPLRVAAVGYTNAWPLTRHLDRQQFTVQEHVPSHVARLLSQNEADIGLIPVGALLTDGDYKVIPGYGIGCDGEVASVLLVGETPIEEWEAVALDGASRTSVILAQILLKGPLNRPGLRVFPVDPGSGAFHAQGRTGAVVLGDAARILPDRLSTRIDLGSVWKEWTGLPFVFAVWASRTDLPGPAIAAIKSAAERGLTDRLSAPLEDRDYLTRNIRYALDDRALMGLRRFAALGFAGGFFARESFSMVLPARRRREVIGQALLEKASKGERVGLEEARVFLELPTGALVTAARLRKQAIHNDTVSYELAGNLDIGLQVQTRATELKGLGADTVVLQTRVGEIGTIDEHVSHICSLVGDFFVTGYSPDALAALAQHNQQPLDRVLDRLVEAGLGGLWGEGADIFALRSRVAPEKLSPGVWAEVLGLANQRGLGGPASMLIGLGESDEERLDHLERLRGIQDQLGLFSGFTLMATLTGSAPPSGAVWLRWIAISRLYLDNFRSIIALPYRYGIDVAQAAWCGGADSAGPAFLDDSACFDHEGQIVALSELERHIKATGQSPQPHPRPTRTPAP